MKVLHILNELMPSGAENMLRVAGPAFQAAGCELHVMSTGATPGPYAPRLAAAGYTVHHRPFAKSPRFFWGLAREVRRGAFDAVHLHAERGFFWFALAMRWSGVPRIVRTVHNNFAFDGLLRWRRAVERRLAARLGVRFVSIAPGVDTNERRRFGVRPTLIANWFDTGRFIPPSDAQIVAARHSLNLSRSDLVVVTVGNCSAVKNHRLLIESLATVNDRTWVYLHVGTEEPKEPERQIARTHGIANHIRFLGPQDDVLPILQAADLYVMPSLYEGIGIAAMEALGTAVPSLFADVAGLEDLREFVSGLRFAAPQREEFGAALRACMSAGRKLSSDPDLLRISAQTHANFGIARGVTAYLALYGHRASSERAG